MSTEILIRLRRLEDEVAYLKLTITASHQQVQSLTHLLKSPTVKQLRDESYKNRVPLQRLAMTLNTTARKLKDQLPPEILQTLKQSRTPDNDKLIRTVEFPEGWFK